MGRDEILAKLRQYYIQERVDKVDNDFLAFEEEMSRLEDLERMLSLIEDNTILSKNTHNSILLYVLGLTNEFDFEKARSDTFGGSPPDIDIDYEAAGRDIVISELRNKWGALNVANIAAIGTFKPKSLTRRFYKLSSGDSAELAEILGAIPPPQFGREATLEQIIALHPELKEKYPKWYHFVSSLEGMVSNFTIHAAGVVISDFPIPEVIPCMKNSKSELITQFDMRQVEELGLIKFDFLVINNLDIIKEAVRLIKDNHGVEVDIYSIPDGDKKTYDLLAAGLLTGIFQMETSGSAKKLIQTIKPKSIREISDISALNRPGPMSAGLDVQYIKNRESGQPPDDMPKPLQRILEDTYWTLVYQEQVMRLVSELAGFSLREADDVRRAMGKKKHDVLEKYRGRFIEGCIKNGIDRAYAISLWDDTLIGFADYGFNLSHSISYSYITYVCAYLKANYPAEFFTALTTIRSNMQPQLWRQKAPEYVAEAKQLGVYILPPDINHSDFGFKIVDGNNIYFGLNAIADVGSSAIKEIIRARKRGKGFKSAIDFVNKVNTSKVTTRTFQALAYAGAFDSFHYDRIALADAARDIYDYVAALKKNEERLIEKAMRDKENAEKDKLRAELDAKIKAAKREVRLAKKNNDIVDEETMRLATFKERVSSIRRALKAGTDPSELNEDDYADYLYMESLKKKPALKDINVPPEPKIRKVKRHDIDELIIQAKYIGCYLEEHPAKKIFPQAEDIDRLDVGAWTTVAGQITHIRRIKTRKGQQMAFIQIADTTGIMEMTAFPSTWAAMGEIADSLDVGAIICADVKVEDMLESGEAKGIVNTITVYRSDNEMV